jgi:hypothetical protein
MGLAAPSRNTPCFPLHKGVSAKAKNYFQGVSKWKNGKQSQGGWGMNNDTALQKIERARNSGALIFVDQGGMVENTPLYKLDVTEMVINKDDDCWNISGKFMPKKEIVNRIGDACGVTFIFGDTETVPIEDHNGKRLVYVSKAQGKKLMPDGTYRQSSVCSYTYDYVLRAMLDYDVTELNAATKQKRRTNRDGKLYGPNLERYIMELQKHGDQKANTGAQLRVIRELAGMPEAFAEKDIQKPLYFGRMIQNTDYILKTPEGRAMATAKALGVDMSALFGSKKPMLAAATTPAETVVAGNTTSGEDTEGNQQGENAARLAAEAAADDEPDFPEDSEGQPQPQEETEFVRLTVSLEEFMTFREYLDVTTKSGANPYKMAQAELDNKNATADSRRKMIDRLRQFLVAKRVPGVA